MQIVLKILFKCNFEVVIGFFYVKILNCEENFVTGCIYAHSSTPMKLEDSNSRVWDCVTDRRFNFTKKY